MKLAIFSAVMALLLVPGFCQEMMGNNFSLTAYGMNESGFNGTITQFQNQLQTALSNETRTRLMFQNMAVDVSSGAVNVSASMNNYQKIVMSANMLRINNEELFNESAQIMAKINLAIMNKGVETNLSIQSQNGVLTMTQAEEGITVRVRNQEMIMQNNSIFLNISNQAIELSVVPLQAMIAAKVQNNSRADVELIVEGLSPKYQIMEQKMVKILGLFETRMNVTSTVNALNGSLEFQGKPWWSFLATE